jgi:UDP-N-acetylmuramoyl-tripeptide--D-alanyl-D-alanine ligase
MDFWTPANLQAVTGGRWLVTPDTGAQAVTGVVIDSRSVKPGQAFFAVRGERFDGHEFVADAAGRGASLIVVSEGGGAVTSLGQLNTAAVLKLADTVEALQSLARAYRPVLRDAGVKVIAVTGSNGKTTTRHLIHTALSSTLKGTQSPKSFNNHLGVPLTLLAALPGDDFVVAEVGTNHPGEIPALADILRPDLGVVTHIGTAHIGQFLTPQALRDEKLSLLAAITPGRDGRCAVCIGESIDLATARWLDAADVLRPARPDRCEPASAGYRFTLPDGLTVSLPLLGRHNVANATLAIAVARWFGVPDDAIAGALASVSSPPMRLEVQHVGPRDCPIVVINDCYNANPDSMRQALSVLREYPKPTRRSRRIAVLGDMLELGDEGPRAHRAVAVQLADGGAIDAAVLIGELCGHTAEALAASWPGERVNAFARWSGELVEHVAALVAPGDVVLLKGSRGMALERLLPALHDAFACRAVA